MVKTPEEKWKDKIIQYRKKCQGLLSISKSIRYAGVINSYGRTLTGLLRPGLKPLLKSEQVKNEFFVISTLISLRKNSEAAVGKLDHVLLQHQKVSILLINRGDVTFYVSLDKKQKGIDELILKIKQSL